MDQFYRSSYLPSGTTRPPCACWTVDVHNRSPCRLCHKSHSSRFGRHFLFDARGRSLFQEIKTFQTKPKKKWKQKYKGELPRERNTWRHIGKRWSKWGFSCSKTASHGLKERRKNFVCLFFQRCTRKGFCLSDWILFARYNSQRGLLYMNGKLYFDYASLVKIFAQVSGELKKSETTFRLDVCLLTQVGNIWFQFRSFCTQVFLLHIADSN